MFRKTILASLLVIATGTAQVWAQDPGKPVTDTIKVDSIIVAPPVVVDSTLRIINLNPFFTIHVDSVLNYQLSINKEASRYYWYLKNSPIGLKINKDNGTLTFKAEKSFFMSGKLKYDQEYKVSLGVQNLSDPNERVDTAFTLVFYNTDIILPKVKPSVTGTLVVEEGDLVSFRVQCEDGNFPIEDILFTSNITIHDYKLVKSCNDDFVWTPPFDFVKETDSARIKILNLSFIGSTKFKIRDTATVRIIVKDALNYPQAKKEYDQVIANVDKYIVSLKYTFVQIDKRLRKTKNTRTTFDLTSATTALSGTILNTAGGTNEQTVGKILPSVGVALVPVKEAAAPNKNVEQNQASLIRASIKRLEYMKFDYALVGERDPAIVAKTNKMKDELRQSQMQLIEVPTDITQNMTEEELNEYFNSKKVQKKYRLTNKK
ncbi:MAG: hypothetical protein NVV59_09985 [Chitinophagaceae bacterium]|nr:hypothetical protein [Chitinophagaceae bacterium]